MIKTIHFRPVLWGLVALLMSSTGWANTTERHSSKLRQMLRGIDIVPSASQILQVVSEPVDALFLVATDRTVSLYERRRAVSFLASFPTEQSAAYLTMLAAFSVEKPIRWIATYSYCRGWARHTPDHVLAFASWMLRSPAAEEREAVLMGLRYVPTDKADTLLKEQHQREQTPRIRGVIDRVMKARKNARRLNKP